MSVSSVARLLLLSFTWLLLLCVKGSVGLATEAREPWLAIPSIDRQIPGDSTAEFREAPDSISDIVIHIPAGGSHINYGSIHTKINTESSDLATKSASGLGGLELRIQLTAAGGFQFQ